MISGVRSALAAAALLLATAAAGEDWSLRALMQDMAEVPARRARFVETRHIALLARPLELTGTLSYERPHRLSKHVQSPFDERMSADGDALTVVNRTRGEQRLFSLSERPEAGALVAGMRATLAGDLAQLERHYKLELSGTRAEWSLRLQPRAANVKAYVEALTLVGAGARVNRIEVLETGGDRSVMTILHDGK
ncbi:MAG: putative transrane protein [Burkholderiales bacterium]|jgi:outer membrane lipoprotein-sorting protein|nr:putative transrane protein [Burkholderiales bacterium]